MGGRMALKLNGKDDRLTRKGFLALKRTIWLSVGDAEIAIGDPLPWPPIGCRRLIHAA